MAENSPNGQRGGSNGAVISAVITGACTLIVGFFGGAFGGHSVGLGPRPTVTVTVTAPAAASAGGVGSKMSSSGTVLFGKTGLELTQNFALSFTDPTLRPFSNNSSCSGDLYVCFEGVGSSSPLAVYPGRAGFPQCQGDTTYVSSFANSDRQSLAGTTLCITTSDRIAACYVTSDTTQLNTPAPALTMDCTVYALK